MVNLTQEELDLLNDTHFLLTKKKITQKVIGRLAEAEQNIKTCLERQVFDFPTNAFQKAGKISKGDHYRDLPYFVLDFPRLFTQKDTFAYRVMVRWGHEMSFTLHLGGASLLEHKEILSASLKKDDSPFICVHETPWEYHFENSNYRPVSSLSRHELNDLLERKFVKISIKHPLNELSNLPILSEKYLIRFIGLLKN